MLALWLLLLDDDDAASLHEQPVRRCIATQESEDYLENQHEADLKADFDIFRSSALRQIRGKLA
jgi:hypothetical protein